MDQIRDAIKLVLESTKHRDTCDGDTCEKVLDEKTLKTIIVSVEYNYAELYCEDCARLPGKYEIGFDFIQGTPSLSYKS